MQTPGHCPQRGLLGAERMPEAVSEGCFCPIKVLLSVILATQLCPDHLSAAPKVPSAEPSINSAISNSAKMLSVLSRNASVTSARRDDKKLGWVIL